MPSKANLAGHNRRELDITWPSLSMAVFSITRQSTWDRIYREDRVVKS